MNYNPAFKIGITGGVCTGKSAVRHILRRLGVTTMDVEETSMHLLLEQSNRLSIRLSDHFGSEVLDVRGRLSPGKLRAVLNAQPEKKLFLNEALGPLLREEIKHFLYGPVGARLRAVEASFLLEMDTTHLYDEVWLITAPMDVRVKRLMERNRLNIDEARRTLETDSGFPEEKKATMCHRQLLNGGEFQVTEIQIQEALEQIRRRQIKALH